jgi:hypothetical protein
MSGLEHSMKPETWDVIEAMFAEFPFMRAEEVQIAEIDAASNELGIPFAADYREFIRRYGGAIVGPYPIFGLRAAEPLERNGASVTQVTRQFRHNRWPGTEHWAVFSIDHAGNPIGFDKEGKVWISDHDAGVLEVIAPDFEEYLRKHCLKLND